MVTDSKQHASLPCSVLPCSFYTLAKLQPVFA